MTAVAIAPSARRAPPGKGQTQGEHPSQPPLSSHGNRDQPPAAISNGFFEVSKCRR
jgi:hypothetical protein